MLELKSHPALYISDMQNAMCHEAGSFSKLGFPVDLNRAIIPRINELRGQAHKAKIPVIFSRMDFDPEYTEAGLLLEGFEVMKDLQGFVRGTWDAQFVDELTPDESNGEIVQQKTTYTAFYKTGFADKLRELGVDQLIVVGVSTPVCVESTVRDAFTHGFHVKTVSDATAAPTVEEQKASIHALDMFGGSTSVADVMEAFKAIEN